MHDCSHANVGLIRQCCVSACTAIVWLIRSVQPFCNHEQAHKCHLIMTAAGRLNPSRVEMELVVERLAAAPHAGKQTHAKLIVGCVNDDRVLLYEHIVLENFPSPYQVPT